MELNIYGLKCDNPTCDYQDNSIQLEQYEDYINHPCPECGAPLLTQADYDTTLTIIKSIQSAAKLGLNTNNYNEEMYKISVQLDGTGIPNFAVNKIK